jgi:hypothetical protein
MNRSSFLSQSSHLQGLQSASGELRELPHEDHPKARLPLQRRAGIAILQVGEQPLQKLGESSIAIEDSHFTNSKTTIHLHHRPNTQYRHPHRYSEMLH